MSYFKQLLLGISILIPAQPAWAATLAMHDASCSALVPEDIQRSLYGRVVRSLARYKRAVGTTARSVRNAIGKQEFMETPTETLAQAAYQEGPVEFFVETDFIGQTESRELMLEEMSQFLGGNTITSLGTRALASMLTTFEKNNMQQVQAAVRKLTQDETLYNTVEKALTQFAQNERSLLLYWDPKKNVKGARPHLFAKAEELKLEELYRFDPTFSIGPQPLDEIPNPAYIATMIGDQFPKPEGARAKALAARARIFGKLFHWVYSIMIAKNMTTVFRDFATQGKFTNPLANGGVELRAALAATFLFWKVTQLADDLKKAHEKVHELGLDDDELKQRGAWLDKAYIELLEKGSFADAFMKTYKGYHPPPADADKMTQWVKDKVSWMVPSFIKGVPSATARLLPHCVMRPVRGVGMMIDDLPWIFASILFIGHRTKQGLTAFGNSLLGFATMDYVWECMQEHASGVAAALRSIHTCHDVVCSDEQFEGSNVCALFEQTTENISEHVREAMAEAHSSVFVQGQSSGGHSLRLHDLLLKAAPDLQPAIHAVAYLDALFALAKSIRSKQGCFVEWLPAEDTQAQIQIEDGIFVGLPKALPNSVALGGDCANKAIVTGPNGAGKSIFIKMVGSNVILAHAFGIAFAKRAHMHWFTCLRTSIDTGESVADELSRMQAQKMRMDSVMNELIAATQADKTAKGLFLTDEPLSGTTHTIAARKLENYCDRIGSIAQMCGIMATHNEEPTKFADKGFVNYQVCIEELPNGMFRPLFKVIPGIPEWWFANDPETVRKQDLFVDYTVAQKHKTNVEKELKALSQKQQKVSGILRSGALVDRKQRRHVKLVQNHIAERIEFLEQELERVLQEIYHLENG